jgi:hypothetical protein
VKENGGRKWRERMAANKMTGKKMAGENGGKEWRKKMAAKKIAGENGGKERRERKWRIKEIKYKNKILQIKYLLIT